MASPAWPRLFRTTAFKLTAIFLAVFTVFAAFLIGYIARNTSEILKAQMADAVDAELQSIELQYARGGANWLARVVELRSAPARRQPLFRHRSERQAHRRQRRDRFPPTILEQSQDAPQIVPYMWRDEQGSEPHSALVRVFAFPDGVHALVGRDVSERDALVGLVRRSLVVTAALMVALGLIAWTFVSRRVLKRIDSIAETSNRFVAGDLSGRLEVTGTGDEFDRLAESLNAHALAHRAADARPEAGLRQHRARFEDAADAHAQPRGARSDDWPFGARLPRGAARDDRRSRPAHPHLQRAASHRARGGRLVRHGVRDFRRDRRRPRRGGALRAGGRGGGRCAAIQGMRAGHRARAPRADQPGACESRRQCRQIRRRGQQRRRR